jgi:hypothetical protein
VFSIPRSADACCWESDISDLNYAVWESISAFDPAFANPFFQARSAGYPTGVTDSPHLFRKLAVAGTGVASAGDTPLATFFRSYDAHVFRET